MATIGPSTPSNVPLILSDEKMPSVETLQNLFQLIREDYPQWKLPEDEAGWERRLRSWQEALHKVSDELVLALYNFYRRECSQRRFPPTPAGIWVAYDEWQERDRRRSEVSHQEHADRQRRESAIETAIPPKEDIKFYQPKCHDCSDRGVARFFLDPKNPRRVWTGPEILKLPESLRARLRSASAVCDCPAGYDREERRWLSPCRVRGKEQLLPVYARMEVVRRMIEFRQAEEKEAIGA